MLEINGYGFRKKQALHRNARAAAISLSALLRTGVTCKGRHMNENQV
jgi:hypothetical protein